MNPKYALSKLAAALTVAFLAFSQICAPSAQAIIAGANWDIHMDIDGIIANDFHIEGTIISGVPGGNFSNPPVLVSHIDGRFPNFVYSIIPDLADPDQTRYFFQADWDGADYQFCEILHLGLMFDLECHNLMIDIRGWWTKDGQPIGDVLLPGFIVVDDFQTPTRQHISVRNQSPFNGQVTDMFLARVSPLTVLEEFGSIEQMLPEMSEGGRLDPLGPFVPGVEWIPVVQWNEFFPEDISPVNPLDFPAESFFDVFFDIEFPPAPGALSTATPIPLNPNDVVVAAEKVRWINPAGAEEWHWFWEIHEGHGLDYGDAPDSPSGTPFLQTLLVNDGARHVAQGILLGRIRDTEPDGQPTNLADGDDVLDGNDDEDGVVPLNQPVPGGILSLKFTILGNGFLSGWADWNSNQQWDAGEQIIFDMIVNSGTFNMGINVPPSVTPGSQVYLRFRVSSFQGLPPFGFAPDGEVEDYLVIVEEEVIEELDYGDAPDFANGPFYDTLLLNDGARHVAQGVLLGRQRDIEGDGQPTLPADGDDFNGVDDEDGVNIPTIAPNQTVNATVNVMGSGLLSVWADLNQDNLFDPSDQIVFDQPVTTGPVLVPISIPATAVPGTSIYLRFRVSTMGGLQWFGLAPDGEVEDYQVIVEDQLFDLDWGDAPDSPTGLPAYRTVIGSNGARHVATGVQLGNLRDIEGNGQPTILADGDDFLDGLDDEDGVIFNVPFVIGLGTSVDVMVTGSGLLQVWADWNQNGVWDPVEQVALDFPVINGTNTVPVPVPPNALPGRLYMRFRVSSQPGLPAFGFAPDGEVEDYLIRVQEEPLDLDWGDAPDFAGGPGYQTVALNNGARHLITGLTLGLSVDPEPNGQPTLLADGDDSDGNNDDDGITFLTPLIAGCDADLQVDAPAGGLLDVWIDIDRNGTWDAADLMLLAYPLNPGPQTVRFRVPSNAKIAHTYARFRLSSVGGLPPDGFAPDGEVEDYAVTVYRRVRHNITLNALGLPVIGWNLHPDAMSYGIYQSAFLNKFPHTWALGPTGLPIPTWTDTGYVTRQFYFVVGEP